MFGVLDVVFLGAVSLSQSNVCTPDILCNLLAFFVHFDIIKQNWNQFLLPVVVKVTSVEQ